MNALLAGLSTEERVSRYRQFGTLALQRAAATGNKALRAEYVALAAAWQGLATEVEHTDEADGAHADQATDDTTNTGTLGAV